MYIHKETKQVINAIPGTPISTGTNRIQDLLPPYLHVLAATPEYRKVTAVIPEHVYYTPEDIWWTEHAPYILDELTEALEKYAPEGYRFGNTDNLTDYGYWLCDEALRSDGWECTDADTGQWARKIDDFTWEYIDNGDGPGAATRIDVRDYTLKQIESIINSYGYTLVPGESKENVEFIQKLYGKHYLQIIAECLFEMDE